MALAVTGCSQVSAVLSGEPIPGGEGAATVVREDSGEAGGIDGVTEWQGQQSDAQGRAFLVARSEPEWQSLWQRLGRSPPGPLPDDQMALAIFLGTRSTGGYGVVIEDVELRQEIGQRDQLVAFFRERRPPAGSVVPQVLTSPYVVKLVERSPVSVRYERLP